MDNFPFTTCSILLPFEEYLQSLDIHPGKNHPEYHKDEKLQPQGTQEQKYKLGESLTDLEQQEELEEGNKQGISKVEHDLIEKGELVSRESAKEDSSKHLLDTEYRKSANDSLNQSEYKAESSFNTSVIDDYCESQCSITDDKSDILRSTKLESSSKGM